MSRTRRLAASVLLLLLGPTLLGGSDVLPCHPAEGGTHTHGIAHGATGSTMAARDNAPTPGSHHDATGLPCDDQSSTRGATCPMPPGTTSCQTMSACGTTMLALSSAAPASAERTLPVPASAAATLQSAFGRPEPPPPRG